MSFGGNDWIVPILVACILAYVFYRHVSLGTKDYFTIAASTLVLLVLYNYVILRFV